MMPPKPSAPPPMVAPDPNSPPDGGMDDQPLYVIEIECQSGGTFEVSLESGQDEANEGSEDQEPESQTAKSWADAMEIANQLYQSKTGGSDSTDQKQGFDSVFDKTGSMP